MPLIYANPAPRRRAALSRSKAPGRKRVRGRSLVKRWGKLGTTSSKRTASGGVAAPKKHKRKKNPMARRRRKKLYGAAAASRKKKMSRGKRRRSRAAAPVRRKRRRARAKVRVRVRRRRRKTVSPSVFRSYRKLHGRRRKRRVVATLSAPRRRRRKGARRRLTSSRHWGSTLRAYGMKRRNPSRRRRRRNPRPSTQGSLLRARRAIRNRWRSPLGAATIKRYKMRSNPSSVKGFLSMLLPVGVTLYGVRAISNKLVGRIPGISYVPAQFQGVTVAALFLGAAHFATKKVRVLAKFRTGAMLGAGLNLLDQVVAAFAPANVKAMVGVGDIYDMGLGEYAQVGDYMQVNGPIDDDIALSDYVGISGVEEDLGLDQELGLEAELGDSLSRAYLGGVSRDSMLKQIGSRSMLAPVPDKSFTKAIGRAGSGFDDDSIYAGIFQSGF